MESVAFGRDLWVTLGGLFGSYWGSALGAPYSETSELDDDADDIGVCSSSDDDLSAVGGSRAFVAKPCHGGEALAAISRLSS
eukprot:6643587-Pyramimonas_sp.AAC.1